MTNSLPFRARPSTPYLTQIRAMQTSITITVADVLTVMNDQTRPGPALEAALRLGQLDAVPGKTGTKTARLIVALRRAFARSSEELIELQKNYAVMRPKMNGDVAALDREGQPIMEQVPFMVEHTKPDGTVEQVTEPGRFMVKPGFDVAVTSLFASEVIITAAPFTEDEFDALAIAPVIKAGLIAFLAPE